MKILVIQQKMIGDVLASSILFEALRVKYPGAQLYYLIYKHTFPVVENNPYIDHFILFDPKKDGNPRGLLQLAKKLKAEKFDVLIDVYSKIGTALLSSYSGAEKRISYRKWYTSFAYTHTFSPKTVLETNAGFAIENRMQLLQAISNDFPIEVRPRIYLKKEEIESAKELLREFSVDLEKPLFMCSILGSSGQKTYPLKYMAKILDHIVELTDGQLLFNYIPNQKHEACELLELCSSYTRNNTIFDLFGRDLREFMALTSHCDALIGNEGGAVNMAKALNIPTFSIFSPHIKKENWSIYEDGKTNVSVHLADFKREVLSGKSKTEISKNAPGFYELLEPNLIFAKLDPFLKKVIKNDRS